MNERVVCNSCTSIRPSDHTSTCIYVPVSNCLPVWVCQGLSVLTVASAAECSMFPMAIVLSRNISIPLSNQRLDPSPVRPKRACSFSSYSKNNPRHQHLYLRQKDRQTNIQIYMYIQTNRQTDGQTYRQTEVQTNRRTDKHTDSKDSDL